MSRVNKWHQPGWTDGGRLVGVGDAGAALRCSRRMSGRNPLCRAPVAKRLNPANLIGLTPTRTSSTCTCACIQKNTDAERHTHTHTNTQTTLHANQPASAASWSSSGLCRLADGPHAELTNARAFTCVRAHTHTQPS